MRVEAVCLKKAISDGCKVILISDMYLPSAILKELLTSCGYDISNIPVYSSGEERYSKIVVNYFQ